MVDGLSRHLHIAFDVLDNELEKDIDDFIDIQLDDILLDDALIPLLEE